MTSSIASSNESRARQRRLYLPGAAHEVMTRARTRWMVVVVFAVAMAWLESATVYYLRLLVDRLEPYQANPLPMSGAVGQVELVREAATLLMLLTVGMLAGRTWQARLGYTAVAFGVWDIFYYVFLRRLRLAESLLDWDVLFLLPLPWWGPVIAPSHRGADDPLGHSRHPTGRWRLGTFTRGACERLVRDCARALCLHGRRDSRRAPGRRRGTDGVADAVQLVDVRRRADADVRAGRADDAARPACGDCRSDWRTALT